MFLDHQPPYYSSTATAPFPYELLDTHGTFSLCNRKLHHLQPVLSQHLYHVSDGVIFCIIDGTGHFWIGNVFMHII